MKKVPFVCSITTLYNKFKQPGRHAIQLLSLLIFLLSVMNSNGQTIVGNNFALKSALTALNKDKKKVFKIALGTIKSETENGYVFLLYNDITDFSLYLIDTSGTVTLDLDPYTTLTTPKRSATDNDFFTLERTKLQPKINGTGVMISFFLPDSLAYDLKGKSLPTLRIKTTHYDKNGSSSSTTQAVPDNTGAAFFKTNANLITSKKGSFDNVEKYKAAPMPLYSLLVKTPDVVEKKLGAPGSTEAGNKGTTIVQYETTAAKYEVTYKDNLSAKIECYPKAKFKYINELFFDYTYPVETNNCDCGEYSSGRTGGVAKGSSEYGIKNTFRDKTEHNINFVQQGRFLQKVVAKVYAQQGKYLDLN